MTERRKIFQLFEEQREYTDKKIAQGIESYRKGRARIVITDPNGRPLPGVRVKAVQKNHEFRFGANLFMLDELETREKNEKYKAYFSQLFNMATLPFYWDSVEPERGKKRYAKDSPAMYRRPPIDLCMEFCQKHGIEPREHALAYDAFFPKWLQGATVEEVKEQLEARFAEIAQRYADRIRTIEVTNEMEHAKGKTAFYDAPDFVEWCFKTAEKYFPNNQLAINEQPKPCWEDCCRYTDKYYSYVEAALLKGARIDAIGMQYHLFNKRPVEYEKTRLTLNPENLYRCLDLYAHLGKPLQITEVTVPSYSWEPEDEQIQAEILEKVYSIWFSHPAVEQIVYWNLVDGYAFVDSSKAQDIALTQGNMTVGENYYHGGLLRFDLSPKPAYYKLKELIQERWHTEEQLVSDRNGTCCFTGFYGEYQLEITVENKPILKEVTLCSKSENRIQVVV